LWLLLNCSFLNNLTYLLTYLAVVDPQAEMCEVCLIQPRDAQHALLPCGHQRFCASCVTQIQQQGRRFKYVPQQHQSDFVFTSDTLDTLFGQYIDVILPTMSLYSNISVILIERFYLIFLHSVISLESFEIIYRLRRLI